MKTVFKVGVTLAIAGAVIWSIPPARKFVKDKVGEFTSAFREAEAMIVDQLLADPPMTDTAAPVGVQEDEDWF